MSNPLIAAESDSTTDYSGIGLAESAVDYVNGIQSGNWAEIGIGAVGVSLETLSIAMDPAGALLSYGIGWLIEHVDALSEALDWLAGNPDAIAAHAQTWGNVAQAVSGVAEDFTAALSSDTTAWQGAAANAYRARATDISHLLQAAATAAQGIGAAVELAGLIVATVREIVRDLIADLVSRLIVYAAELAATLGLAAPWVAAQATSLIAKWAAKIADIISKLVRTISNLLPLLRNLDEIFSSVTDAMRALRRGTRHTDTPPTPTSPSTPSPSTTAPSTAHAPDTGGAPATTTPQSGGGNPAPSGTNTAATASGTPDATSPGPPHGPGQQSAISRALDGPMDEPAPDPAGGSSRPGDVDDAHGDPSTTEWADYDGNPDFRASEADRDAFRDSYAGYADDADFVRDLQARDPSLASLSEEELVAIRGYTGNEFYRPMNEGLREGDPALLDQYDPHIRTLTSGLNQLPPYEGAVGRGITVAPERIQDLIARYEPGQVIREPSFVSTDTSAAFPGNVQFEIHSRTGRDISDFSHFPGDESEVLFPPGAEFRVLERRFDPTNQTWYIQLTQDG